MQSTKVDFAPGRSDLSRRKPAPGKGAVRHARCDMRSDLWALRCKR